jgi:BASS family bile acid:Na+ symporter
LTLGTFVEVVLVLAIVLIVLAIGLRARLADPFLFVRTPAFGFRAMLSIFIAFPLFVILVTSLLPLGQPVRTALLTLAVSPTPPVLVKDGTSVGGHGDYVIGLQVIATVVSIVIVPVMLLLAEGMYGVDITYAPWAMVRVLLVTVAAPLAIGVTLARLVPRAAPRLAHLADRAGTVALVIATVVSLRVSAPAIAGLIGQGTLVAVVAIIGFGLLVGHWLGGPGPGNRGALAVATAARHPGVALVLATGVFPEHETAINGTLELYLLANVVMTVPYARWRKRSVAKA